MNITEIGIVFSIAGSLAVGTGTGMKYYGDHEYLRVSDALRGQLYSKQLEIQKLKIKPNPTPEDKALQQFLELQESQIKQDLGI